MKGRSKRHTLWPPVGAKGWIGASLACLIALGACSDDGSGGDGEAESGITPNESRRDGSTGPATPGHPGDTGLVSLPDVPSTRDDAAAPQLECTDEGCGPGRVCHDGRCIEGMRCDDNSDCPGGFVCIASICFADSQATGGLVAEPDVILFTFAEVGLAVTRQTTLRNDGSEPIDVTQLRFEGSDTFALSEAVELPMRLVAGQREAVTVSYVPDDENVDAGSMFVHTNQEGASALEVRLASQRKVVGGRHPCLEVAPTSLNFGAVGRGGNSRQTFELISCGADAVQISAIRRGVSILGELPEMFQLAAPPALPITLRQQGERHPIEVIYTPMRAGLNLGFWEIHSNDAQNPIQRVDVVAIAEPPPLQDVALHVRLAWDTDLTDVDLHLLSPGGQMWTCEGDCYFANGNPNWGDPNRFEDDPFLDVDDVDGFGPENINLEDPAPGTYRVIVHYWDDHDGEIPESVVEVLRFGQVMASYGPMRTPSVGDTWEVVDIEVPGFNLTPLGDMANLPNGDLCGPF